MLDKSKHGQFKVLVHMFKREKWWTKTEHALVSIIVSRVYCRSPERIIGDSVACKEYPLRNEIL